MGRRVFAARRTRSSRLPRHEAARLREALEKLAENPRAADIDIKKLQPLNEGVFRLRIGDYRLLFTFDKPARMLRAQSADDRKDAYGKSRKRPL